MRAEGSPRHRFRVVLALCAAITVALQPFLRGAAEPVPTVITSDSAEMVSTDTESTFTFSHNVVVTGTNLRMTCDKLVVVATRTGDPTATIGRQDRFKSLVATGKVRIVQNDREALCDRAEVIPGQEEVVLTGRHVVVQSLDGQYRAEGTRAVLYRGRRRAVMEGNPGERPHVTLPTLKDLGYGNQAGKTQPAANPGRPAPGNPKK